MKERDLEKLFEEKLRNHQVTPPPQSWDKLHTQLYGQRKTPVYWKAAAALLLLLGAVLTVYLQMHDAPSEQLAVEDTTETVPQVAQEIPEPSKNPEEQLATEKPATNHQEIPVVKEKAVKKTMPSPSQPVVAVVQDTPSATVTRPSAIPTVAYQPLAAFATSQTDVPDHAEMVTQLAQFTQHAPVKIIYKGEKPENKPQEKAFAFFDQLKASNVSLSELRQAKDEWINKAFR